MKFEGIKYGKDRLRAFIDGGAWMLIVVGLILFCLRIAFEPGGFLNLPVAVTVLQTAGLMFTIAGLQIIISRIVWPALSVTDTLNAAKEGNTPAGLVLLGLFLYNGITTVAFVMWLSSALGAGLGAQ